MKDIKKFKYTDILGWSISRYERFLKCKRQYFYDYYAKFDEDTPLEKINFLKNLTSKALEIGNIVHDIIKDILERYQKSTKPINKDKFFKYSFNSTEKHCCKKIFYENYYNGEIILPSEIYARVKKCLEIFLASKRFAWIEMNAVPRSSEWVIEPEGFGEMRINNYKAFCKVDFLFPIGDKAFIIDWKTGKPDEAKHSKQLQGYALWTNYHFDKKIEDITPMIVYLYPQYSEKEVKIEDCSIKEFTNTVIEETKNMYEYLADIEKNIPKNKEEFVLTDNRVLCNYCNYRELCPSAH